MIESFDILNINKSIITGLLKEDIRIPTAVQQKVIPEALKNKDLVVQSPTGSGKTLAYLIPLFEKINPDSREMSSLILVPTHELAIQVLRQIEILSKNSEIAIKAVPIIGNVNIVRQIENLKEKPHIIVGSPGRVLELIKKKKISAHTIKTIILDEADKLIDENNINTVEAIIKTTLKERQIMMFSATMAQESIKIAKKMMKDPHILREVARATIPDTIEHYYFLTEERDKVDVLRKLIGIINPTKALVFINKSNDIEVLTAKLNYHNIPAQCIHGANLKLERQKIMDGLKTGTCKIVVASDMASRGIDIDGITHVFNMDTPEDPQNYLHRVGRTGRIGHKGVAISIISRREHQFIKMYETTFKVNILPKIMYKGSITDKRSNEK